MNARTKRMAYQELSLEMKKDFAQQKQIEQEEKKAIREKFPAQTWDEYLISRAEEGNTEALAVLRRRKRYRRQISEALLTVESFEEAKDVIKAHFKPTVLSNGKVIYRAKDGGVVSDEATVIRVPTVTEGAVLLALSLADERFHGKAVVVEGTDEFKFEVMRLSALEGLSIRFVDPVLEKGRQRHVRAKELSQEWSKRYTQEKKEKEQHKGHDSSRDYRGR